MDDKKNLKIFINFLKKEGVYTYYLKALKEDKHYRKSIGEQSNPIYFIVSCIKNNHIARLINSGFEWGRANESLWANLHDKWIKVCESRNFI